MSVLLVSPSVVGGGAEKVAVDLHREYRKRGMHSMLAVGVVNGIEPGSVEIPRDAHRSPWASAVIPVAKRVAAHSSRRGDVAWAASSGLRVLAEPRRFARVRAGFEDFEFPQTARILELATPRPDILHLHNLHGGFFDFRALPGLSAAVPTFMTLHDMWALTGHCAYSLDCERWRTGCGECPYLDLYVRLRKDESAANRATKREALLRSRVRIATPSAWLARFVEDSGVLGDSSEVRVVPNGVDTSVFVPGDRLAARAELGLPADRTIVLFAARALRGSRFKGFGTLTAALELIGKDERAGELLLVGLGEGSDETSIGGVETRFLPFVDDPARVARYYQAADLYLHPAVAENLPLAIIESMACGTPVVASRVGGIPEIVVDGETGLLADANDPAGLAAAVMSALGDRERLTAFSRASVERVSAHFTLDAQVDAYLGWYREALEAAR